MIKDLNRLEEYLILVLSQTDVRLWEVISKKGRAIFTNQEEFKTFGNIALKVRY